MKVNFNISAVIANNALATSDSRLSKSLERLSSGLKINHAKDNPAGLAISKRMNAQLKGLSIATQNASDGISVIETAEGALSEVHAMLQRMNELAVKSSTGSINDSDRVAIQDEVDELKEEITRIARDTDFNGQALLNGSFDLKGYTNVEGVSFDYYADEVEVAKYDFTIDTITKDADGKITDVQVTMNQAAPNEFPPNTKVEYKDNLLHFTGPDGFEMKVKIEENVADNTPVTLDATGIGAMRLQIGANEGQLIEIRIPIMSLENIGVANVDMSTEASSRESIQKIAEGISFVSQARSRLGAYQNRLEHSTSSLDITNENMTGAYSRIIDVNMATEMTEYTNLQVMVQAGTSMLAQANERPQQVLQLLQ